MVKIKYNEDVMKYMSIFETLTKAKLKDCILNDNILFIVHEDQIGKAIGKKGSNIKMLGNVLKRKIKIVEFSQNVVEFIKNLIYPLQFSNIENNNEIITISGADTKTKGLLIGRDRHNLNNLISIVKRYFDIKEINVV